MTTHIRARTYAEAAQELAELEPHQVCATVDLLARTLGRTDGDLHRRTGISRHTSSQKRTGAKPIRAGDLWPLAEALDVEIGVLLLPPADALQWLIDNRRKLLNGGVLARKLQASKCTAAKLNRPLSGAKLLARRSASGLRAAA